LLTKVSQRLGRVPRMLLATWVAVMCVLVAVPVALTLARESRFVVSMDTTRGDAQISHSALAASVRRLVEPPKVSKETARDARAKPFTARDARVIIDDAALAARVTATPTARGVLVRVWGRTPKEAARLADALALRLTSAAVRKEEPRIVLGPRRLPRPTGFVDRAVDALPGPFPGRADPVWVGFAGFLVALLAWTSIILVRSEGGPRLRVETRAARESRQESREPLA
jgi:hypothetical protein